MKPAVSRKSLLATACVAGVRGVNTLVVLAAIAAWPTALHAQSTILPSRLVRCSPAVDLPCVVSEIELSAREARLASKADTVLSRNWTGRLAGLQLIGPVVRPLRATSTPFKLLILVDLSGSMRGEGVAFVRSAVRGFLSELPPVGVTVAVAPFESRNVVGRIASATYRSPSEAAAVLDALPPPDAAGNTALYDAVRSGVTSVDAAVRASGADTRGGVLLITDGKNDVGGRRDDAGLLSGADGQRVAREAAEKSGNQLWIIGAGDVDAAELRGLAGARSQPYIIALSPVLLQQSLTSIAREISTARELVFGLSSGSRLRLARARVPGAIRFQAIPAGGEFFDRLLAWRPPLIALPAFEGVADSSMIPSEVRSLVGVEGGDANRRWMLLLFCSLAGILFAGMLPRFGWSRPVVPAIPDNVAVRAPASGAAVVAGIAAKPAAAANRSGLRGDVHEVAPRKPDEITGTFAPIVP